MKYSEFSFRDLDQQFSVVQLNHDLRRLAMDLPYIDQSDCLLIYGYIDHTAGMSFEVITSGKREGDHYRFFPGNSEASMFIRLGAIAHAEGEIIEDIYYPHIEPYVNEDIINTRNLKMLDHLRHPYYPDDIQFVLATEEIKPEICWARLSYVSAYYLKGVLLNEPKQDFDVHEGSEVYLYITETEDGQVICFSDGQLPNNKREILEDGSILKSWIDEFCKNTNHYNFAQLLQVLRDSYVWVPYNQEEQDYELLISDNRVYLPVFHERNELNGYCVKLHMLDVIEIEREFDDSIEGIILDPYDGAILLDSHVIKIIERLESLIQD